MELEKWKQTMYPFRALKETEVKEMPFPFEPVPGVEEGKGVEGSPLEMKMERVMSFEDFFLMMKSFSPVQQAREKGVDLLNAEVKETLSKAWGPESVRTVLMPIYIILGTVSAPYEK
ncbi:unnamed protein product [Calypogeia fissa]